MLSDSKVAGFKPAKGQQEYPDAKVTGLRLRVGAGGTKTWIFRARTGGRTINKKLGSYPGMDLTEARTAALKLVAAIARGGSAEAVERTFGGVAEHWIRKVAKPKNDSWRLQERMAHGPPAPSNIALDGRLLDFGGMCSLPDWGGIKLYPGFFEHNDVFPRLASCLHDFYAEHDDGGLTDGTPAHDYASRLAERCREVYFKTIGVEMLRLAGLRRETINSLLGDEATDSGLIDAVTKAMTFYLRHFRDSIEAADASELWDFERFWDERPPAHLRPLRAVADDMAARARGEPITRRMVARCWPKRQLYHEHFRLNLQRLLPEVQPGAPVDEEGVAALVTRQVVAARRDSKFEPRDGYLYGFAATATAVYSLFRSEEGAWAVDESAAAAQGGAAPPIAEPVPVPIAADNIDGLPVIEIKLFDS